MPHKTKKARVRKPSRSKYLWYHKFIVSRVRQVFQWSPAKKAALARAKDRCELCEEYSEVLYADHIVPCVPVTGWDGYDGLISRTLDATSSELQSLCKSCHQEKTNRERAERKKNELKTKVG